MDQRTASKELNFMFFGIALAEGMGLSANSLFTAENSQKTSDAHLLTLRH